MKPKQRISQYWCCLWADSALLLMQPQPSHKKPEGLTKATFHIQYNHSRPSYVKMRIFFLLSLCVFHRNVARANKKGRVPGCAVVD